MRVGLRSWIARKKMKCSVHVSRGLTLRNIILEYNIRIKSHSHQEGAIRYKKSWIQEFLDCGGNDWLAGVPVAGQLKLQGGRIRHSTIFTCGEPAGPLEQNFFSFNWRP